MNTSTTQDRIRTDRDSLLMRLRSLALHECDNPASTAGIACSALRAIRPELDEPSTIAGIFLQAGEATSSYTEHGDWDEDTDEIVDRFEADANTLSTIVLHVER